MPGACPAAPQVEADPEPWRARRVQYLAKVDALSGGVQTARAKSLTDRVLQSNPILEAFGNAQAAAGGEAGREGGAASEGRD